MDGGIKKKVLEQGGLIARNFPLEKGVPYNWNVRLVELNGGNPTLSVGVVQKQHQDSCWAGWGVNEGWVLSCYHGWGKSIFAHRSNQIDGKEMPVHTPKSGDLFEVYLSDLGELSFILNGKEMGTFPSLLEWEEGESLYPAVFMSTSNGGMDLEIEVGTLNIKPAKRD
mmetsp:Transcript_7915/g.10583  ORF Transcript_7915/g.10583 Transcript_7915/m.10583 type:complete len:168 (+) Transcript_7915:131-634(+)